MLQEIWANEMALVIGLNAPKLRILQRCVHKQHTLARKGQLVVCVLLYLAVVDLGLLRAHTNNNEMRQKEVLILISLLFTTHTVEL